ncbi:putative ribonuclease H-like domain-containing protein [Tanacetum coccineum]
MMCILANTNDHPLDQVIGDFQSATQTKKMSKNLEEHGFVRRTQKVIHALQDPSWIEAMKEELLQFKLQEVWTLVDLPNGKRAIGSKWVFRNLIKDERANSDKNKARQRLLKDTHRRRIDYDEVFALLQDFVVYQIDVKVPFSMERLNKRAWYETLSTYLLDNGFQRGKINKTLFIKRHKGDILLVQVYVDDIIFGSTKKDLCLAFEKLMHEKF